MAQQLVLYYKPTCGYCRKVLNFIEAHSVPVELKNVLESSDNRNQLIDLTGRTQVPCLVIDGDPMHESDDIVAWLKENNKTS